MVRRVVDIGLIVSLSLVALTASSVASTPSKQATDPNADSPAGVVYSIPLDSARQDAAPHGHTGGTGGSANSGTGGGGSSGTGASGGTGGTGGGGGSGSGGSPGDTGSGTTPGASTTRSSGGSGGSGGGAGGSGAARGSQAVLVPGGQPGSLIHSANGFGSSSSVPGLNSSPSAGLAAVQGDASSAPILTILLAVVLLLVGGLIGVLAWRPHARVPADTSSAR